MIYGEQSPEEQMAAAMFGMAEYLCHRFPNVARNLGIGALGAGAGYGAYKLYKYLRPAAKLGLKDTINSYVITPAEMAGGTTGLGLGTWLGNKATGESEKTAACGTKINIDGEWVDLDDLNKSPFMRNMGNFFKNNKGGILSALAGLAIGAGGAYANGKFNPASERMPENLLASLSPTRMTAIGLAGGTGLGLLAGLRSRFSEE